MWLERRAASSRFLVTPIALASGPLRARLCRGRSAAAVTPNNATFFSKTAPGSLRIVCDVHTELRLYLLRASLWVGKNSRRQAAAVAGGHASPLIGQNNFLSDVLKFCDKPGTRHRSLEALAPQKRNQLHPFSDPTIIYPTLERRAYVSAYP